MTTSLPTRYVALAERMAQAMREPRVRALHLPPTLKSGATDAEFCAIELDDGAMGFSYVLLDGVGATLHARTANEPLAGIAAAALARGYASADPVARALGLAAINALSQQLFARAGWIPPRAGDSLGAIAPQAGEHIGMIGYFRPLIPQVVAAGARLTVLELKAELAAEHPDHQVTLDPAALASCTKVVSTCTVLLNDTLDAVLAACRNARHVAIIGPTAGCVPDLLFAAGVGSLGGRRVIDADGLRDALRRGGRWGAFAEKYVIARDDYPGIDALLAGTA